jgi:hypothetical protein
MISKLVYDDKDNLIFHLIQSQIKFHLFLLEKSREEGSDLNSDLLIHDLTKLKIIKDLYESI